ncbi:restriction endonuclease subunit S [Vibrio sp. 624788]|uniref:restriction endonuclease subunit S n=1 Tax=Vibrio sp. 624788 TaxID=1234362 RepID=UPI0002F11E45|nr:restriction endonuclease subunit S [Vibrio sp. 624788]
MSCNWPVVTLAEITSRIGDGLHGTPKYDDNGDYYFINGNNLSNGKIVINEKTKRTDESQYLKHKKDLNERTLLVSINGTLGNIGTYQGEKVFLGKSACYLNVLPSVNKDYVMYVLTSKHFQDYIHNLATGSTIKNVGLKLIREYEFQLPDTETQDYVANVLVSIDSKITVNQQINKNLEEMAQALFKSWFVDFDPVKAKMNGEQPEGMDVATASLFPEKLVESELGLIPDGWIIHKTQDLFEVKDGTHDSPKKAEEGHYLVTSKHITKGKIDTSSAYLISDVDFEKVNQRSKVDSLDILLTMIGTVGEVVVVYDNPVEFAIKNVGLFKTSQRPELVWLFYWHLQSFQMKHYLEVRMAGTTQQYLTLKTLRTIPVVLPSDELLKKFNEVVAPLMEKISDNHNQNKTLSNLRDTLLPKLLSGEIELVQVQELAEVE